jgi:hypothetical protein
MPHDHQTSSTHAVSVAADFLLETAYVPIFARLTRAERRNVCSVAFG